jgi:hypothetical protein
MKNTLLYSFFCFVYKRFASQETTAVSNDSLLKYLTDLKKEVQELKKPKAKQLGSFLIIKQV